MLSTAIGLAVVLPMGMVQVSSIILTAEVGTTLRKGEEISYFQFGGGSIVCIFEARSNVSVTAQVDIHCKMTTRIARAFPGGVKASCYSVLTGCVEKDHCSSELRIFFFSHEFSK